MSRGLRTTGRFASWLVILGMGVALTVGVVVPRRGAPTPYAVLTDSMRPDLPPGTLVVMRSTPAEELGVGDVITYQLGSGEQAVATHRIVTVGIGDDGERIFQTQGDANDTPDAAWVRPVQVKGKLWYSVPVLGHAHRLLTAPQRQWGVYAVAGAFFGYAALMFVGAARTRRQQPLQEVSHA
jgi:signal peptidase